MWLEVFVGRDVAAVHEQARAALGEDALIASTRSLAEGNRSWIEVRAASAEDVNKLIKFVSVPAIKQSLRSRSTGRPYVIALVGPTGAGKTTTLAKLAAHPDAFGHMRAGFLTLDTHRAGAFEQLAAYADAVGLPCEIAYDKAELKTALKRLASCEVVLVDTPGRGPQHGARRPVWRSLLTDLRPDETHLVVPAIMRSDLIDHMLTTHGRQIITHTLVTKLDEVPADLSLATTIVALGLPSIWATDGQHVPADLKRAAPVALAGFGITPPRDSK